MLTYAGVCRRMLAGGCSFAASVCAAEQETLAREFVYIDICILVYICAIYTAVEEDARLQPLCVLLSKRPSRENS